MDQQCLFCGGDASAPDHRARCDGRQGGLDVEDAPVLDLVAARAARDVSVRRVAVGANRVFLLVAGEAIRRVAQTRATFVIDDVWQAREQWPTTHDRRAMGAAMQQAKRDKWITPTETFAPSAQRHCHANPRRVWRSLIRSVSQET